MRSTIFYFCLLGLFWNIGYSQEKQNEFFTFLNMMEGDSVKRTLEYDITYVQSVGYDGIGYNLNKNLKEITEIINDYDFKSTVVYFEVDIDQDELDASMKDRIKLLKGSKAILTPSFYSSGKYMDVSEEGDAAVTKHTLSLSKLARKAKLDLAINHRHGTYVQSHKHAFALAKKLGKIHIGFCFNLSHWLAVEGLEERNGVFAELMEYIGKLKVVTINGANRVLTENENPWDDYLLPLGKGTFDTYNLVEYLVEKQGYTGPIGVECKGLTGDKMQLAEDVMLVWKSYLSFMKEKPKEESN